MSTDEPAEQPPEQPPEQPTWWEAGRHPVHVAHLVMGLVLAGLLAIWALLWTGAVEGADARWLLPLPWLLAGAIGLLAAGRSARRNLGAAD